MSVWAGVQAENLLVRHDTRSHSHTHTNRQYLRQGLELCFLYSCRSIFIYVSTSVCMCVCVKSLICQYIRVRVCVWRRILREQPNYESLVSRWGINRSAAGMTLCWNIDHPRQQGETQNTHRWKYGWVGAGLQDGVLERGLNPPRNAKRIICKWCHQWTTLVISNMHWRSSDL